MSETWIWDQYWHFDRVASCFDGAGADNYEEGVAAGWRFFFEALPDGTRILDLCTGNGAIAIIAAQVSRAAGKGFDIVAVDRAAIDPHAFVSKHRAELEAIRFVPGTEAEALPFPDGGFGAVVSQYGLEYTDLARSMAELGRVIAPGGRARMVVHASDGTVADKARLVVADADMLLDDIDLPGAASRCFEAVTAVERSAAPDADARARADRCFADFQTALERTARRIGDCADIQMYRNAGGVLLDTYSRRSSFDLAQMQSKVDDLRTEIMGHRARVVALLEAALDRDGSETLAGHLRTVGASTSNVGELRNGVGLIGYWIEAAFDR